MARTAKTEKALSPEEKLAQALVPDMEQPYRVPKNWCWTKMDCVAQWGSGGTPSRGNASFFGGNIPWVKTGELNDDYIFYTDETLTEEGLAHSSAKLFPINTIVIAMYGATVGKVGILGIEASTNQACACGICTPIIDYRYLFYYARSQKDAFIDKARGGAQPNISQEIIKTHPIPLPPLAEQQRIVDRIESLFAKLDEAKEKAQAVVDGFEDRRAAILHKAFTGELTAEWRLHKGISFADSWEKRTLGDFASSQYGYTEKSSSKKIGPKFLRITDIQNGQVVWKDVPYCKIDDELKEKYLLNIGDIVVARTGATTGKSYMVIDEVDAVYASYLIRVSIKKKALLRNKYLYYFMQCPSYWWQITELSSGIAQPGVNGNKLKTLQIPIPNPDEQDKIVDLLDHILPMERQDRDSAELVLDRIDAMKKSILARAFRGELGTNDPDEESAVEMVKRVMDEGRSKDAKQTPTRKRVSIPKDLDDLISTGMEREVVKLFIKSEDRDISMNEIMSLSSRKFELLDTIKALEKKGILSRNENGKYSLTKRG